MIINISLISFYGIIFWKSYDFSEICQIKYP